MSSAEMTPEDAREYIKNHVEWLRQMAIDSIHWNTFVYHAKAVEQAASVLDVSTHRTDRKVIHMRSQLGGASPYCKYDNKSTRQFMLTDEIDDVTCKRCLRYADLYTFPRKAG